MRSPKCAIVLAVMLVPAGAVAQMAPVSVPAAPDRYTGYLPGLVIDQDGYPPGGVFGWGLNTYSETLSVRRRIPASSVTRTAPAALAGYAYTQSAVAAAVGVFGLAAMSVDAPGAWGGNFLATNCAADDVNCARGGHNTILYGAEIDVNEHALPGGGAPLGGVLGLHISGGSTVRPTGGSSAIHIDPMDGYTRTLPWTQAILSEDGAALTGLRLGALANTGPTDVGAGLVTPHPANSPSQAAAFRAVDGAGTVHEATVHADADANLVLAPGQPGGSVMVVAGSLRNGGHYAAASPDVPTLGGCGAGLVRAGSNDTRGAVDLPAGQASCAVRFRHPGAAAPFCVASSNSPLFPAAVLTPGAEGVTLAVRAGNPAVSITWQCLD